MSKGLEKLKRRAERARAAQAPGLVPGNLANRLASTHVIQPRQVPVSSASFFAKRKEARKVVGDPYGESELGRILRLPVQEPMTKAEVEEFSRTHLLSTAYNSGYRFWDVQCEAISGYEQFGGAFLPIGVGHGKGNISIAMAEAAYQEGKRKILLLVPAPLVVQTMQSLLPLARKIMPVSFPVQCLGGRSAHTRKALARSGRKGLYVLPYSCLSTKDASETLKQINPEVIICDEAHYLGNRTSARTKRLFNYIRENDPQGVCMSGTITGNSIQDYYHLIKWCLREYCPLPLVARLAGDWGQKIDASAGETEASGPLMPLVRWAQNRFPTEAIQDDLAGFRAAFRIRLNTAPGVATTGDAEVKASLTIFNTPVAGFEKAKGYERLSELAQQVTDAWLTPNGDEIEHALHKYKWLYELAAGFYNELTWPSAEVFAERERVSVGVATKVLDAAKSHHGIQQQYHSELRSWIEECGFDGCDTPMLVGHEISRNGGTNVGRDLAALWQDLHTSKTDLTSLILNSKAHHGSAGELDKRITACLRDSRVVRVCDFKVAHAVKWAKKVKGGAILWVYHKGIGSWLVEEMTKAGLDPIYCPAGDAANLMLSPANLPKIKDRLIVASITAHHEGKNLQLFHQQYFTQWPRSPKQAEQAIGRLHRMGQKANEVMTVTCATLPFDHQLFAATLNDALYIHQTTGNRQKLVYADYAPTLPPVFPFAVLRERGFQNKQLNAEQKQLMADRFGVSGLE